MNKQQVAQNFSQATASYERWAKAQKAIAERLVSLMGGQAKAGRVLDIGCGTGILTALLEARFSPEHLCGIDLAPEMIRACRQRWPRHDFLAADAEEFEASPRYDLIASNCAFQWFHDKPRAVERFCARLAPGGMLALAVPVAGSFPELERASRQAAGRGLAGLRLAEPAEYLAGCRACAGELLCQRVECLRIDFPSAWDVLRSFKGTGSAYHPADYQPYTVSQMGELCRRYQHEHRNADQSIPMTYRVLFLILRAPGR